MRTGHPDTKRFPKAIQSILSNRRGTRVHRTALGGVFVRLDKAAPELRTMPCRCATPADAYTDAHDALQQLGRLSDVRCCSE